MRTLHHLLTATTPGTQRSLISQHFGPGGGRKAYLQASLHADEPPGMLVLFHLRKALLALEQADQLIGEIVLVPMANPIGAAQRVLGATLGRFDLSAGENFNRHYADLSAAAYAILQPQLAMAQASLAALPDSGVLPNAPLPDVNQVRAALREACANLSVHSELQSLRRCLLGLAIDADFVLDLHCDQEAVMHVYASTPQWPHVEPFARALGAQVSLLATDSGDDPFDESCSMLWSRLNQCHVRAGGAENAWPLACVAVTIELRGQADVSHAYAQADAQALVLALHHAGFMRGPAPALPALLRAPSALAASLPVITPSGGVLVHSVALGQEVAEGELIAEVIDPISGAVQSLLSPCAGILFARESARFVQAGVRVAKVAGLHAKRSGNLLSD